MSDLNVLYLNHVGQISGAEQSLRSLLWQLRRAYPEIEATVALPGAGPFAEQLRDEGYSVTFAPMQRIMRPDNILAGAATLVHVLRTAPFLAKLIRGSGAKIVHSNSTTAHLVGSLAAERARVPAVWHARDLVSLEPVGPSLSERASKVIAISKCVAGKLVSEGVQHEKVVTIYNGLDPDEWRAKERSQLRASLGVPDDAFVFGCPSQLVPWKNHGEFIDAAGKLCADAGCAQARFVILGGDLWGEHADYVKQLRAKVKEHNLQERFNFVPHQRDNVDALSAFDAIVLPSREEPFGRVLIEGMALQKTVIGFNVNGPSEIVTHEHDGLLADPEDENSLVEMMSRAMSDDARDLGQQARQTVETRFHISDGAAQIAELYRELTA